MSEHEGFRVERGRIATITLDVPGKLNRVTMPARGQLGQVFAELGRDADVRVVVVRGAGDKAFTAGGDIAMFLQSSAETVSLLHHDIAAAERCPKPVIAALHGYCFGVGFELALACDFRIAADDTQLALPELTLGMIPGSGGAPRLVKLVGAARAKELVMRGRRIGASEAHAWGLVGEVVAPAELDAAVARLAEELASRPAVALRMAKRVIAIAQNAPLETALEVEGLTYGLLRETHDFAEGVAAFGEKRPPAFEDR